MSIAAVLFDQCLQPIHNVAISAFDPETRYKIFCIRANCDYNIFGMIFFGAKSIPNYL